MYNLFMVAGRGGILGPISEALGFVMNAIYQFFEKVLSIEFVSIPVVIIIFTVVVYLCMLPLTYKQQKFSFMMAKMNPELEEMKKKYKNKRDQESMMAMQEEQKAIYDKYGVSATGSCIQLIIQLPILMALYDVFRNVSFYITSIRDVVFAPLIDAIQSMPGYVYNLQSVANLAQIPNYVVNFFTEGLTRVDYGTLIADMGYRLNAAGWEIFSNMGNFVNFPELFTSTQEHLHRINTLFVLNISESPLNIIQTNWEAGAYGMVFAALMIPVCSFASQVLSIRTMNMTRQAADAAGGNSMRLMNRIMPFISLIFVFNVPVGLGLYWIIGALFRAVSQVLLNRHFRKIDMDAVVEQNKEKAAAKAKKRRQKAAKYANITAGANANTNRRTTTDRARIDTSKLGDIDNSQRQYKQGSLASKANMVNEYNTKNSRKSTKSNSMTSKANIVAEMEDNKDKD